MSTMLERIWLAEVEGFNPATEQVETLRFATAPINPFPGTDPHRPDAHYPARLKGTGSLSRQLFSGMRSYGASSVNAGEVTLANADGALDDLVNWGFDGRALTIYEGRPGDAFDAFNVALSATMSQPEFVYSKNQPSRVVLRVRDYQDVLRVPMQETKYEGSNVGDQGNEGTANDIKGQPKPLVYGVVRNVRPAPCNTVAHRYQVHDGPGTEVDHCYDNGIELSRNDVAPQPGEYAFDASTGIITLGGTPAGEVTCDATGAAEAGRSVADLIQFLVPGYTSLGADKLVTDAFTALNGLNSATVGIYLNAETTVAEVVDQLCGSIGAYWTFTRDGRLSVGRIDEPQGSGVWDFGRRDIVEISRVARQDSIPPHILRLHYQRNWTPQSADGLAGAVSEDRRAWLAAASRSVVAVTPAVRTKHLLSPQMERDSLIDLEADAQAECNRLSALYGDDRHTFKITVKSSNALKAIELGDVVRLSIDRFNLNNGEPFVVLGIEDNIPREGRMTFTIWG